MLPERAAEHLERTGMRGQLGGVLGQYGGVLALDLSNISYRVRERGRLPAGVDLSAPQRPHRNLKGAYSCSELVVVVHGSMMHSGPRFRPTSTLGT